MWMVPVQMDDRQSPRTLHVEEQANFHVVYCLSFHVVAERAVAKFASLCVML